MLDKYTVIKKRLLGLTAFNSLVIQGFERQNTPRAQTHTRANTHFLNFVNALKRVKTPSKIHEKYTVLNAGCLA